MSFNQGGSNNHPQNPYQDVFENMTEQEYLQYLRIQRRGNARSGQQTAPQYGQPQQNFNRPQNSPQFNSPQYAHPQQQYQAPQYWQWGQQYGSPEFRQMSFSQFSALPREVRDDMMMDMVVAQAQYSALQESGYLNTPRPQPAPQPAPQPHQQYAQPIRESQYDSPHIQLGDRADQESPIAPFTFTRPNRVLRELQASVSRRFPKPSRRGRLFNRIAFLEHESIHATHLNTNDPQMVTIFKQRLYQWHAPRIPINLHGESPSPINDGLTFTHEQKAAYLERRARRQALRAAGMPFSY